MPTITKKGQISEPYTTADEYFKFHCESCNDTIWYCTVAETRTQTMAGKTHYLYDCPICGKECVGREVSESAYKDAVAKAKRAEKLHILKTTGEKCSKCGGRGSVLAETNFGTEKCISCDGFGYVPR